MAVHIALLRAVNLPSHGQVAMPELRKLIESLGFGRVRSLLNSGNLVFSSDGAPGEELEGLLERETARHLDLPTEYLVRGEDEWASAIAENPLPAEAERDPSHLLVMFLKAAPELARLEALRAAVAGPEVIAAGSRHLYITYPAGIGRSKLTSALIESKLGTRGTGRNWNTVLKLQALASE
ncbi:MAG: DUF1697 domain-containing protein [Chloroflexota bacterium]|nr:DUF1697 domain-containing protein [Chloroflexota bacterium]